MSKSPKQSEEPAPKSKSKRSKSNKEAAAPKGRLIALEGTRGKDLAQAAERLARQLGSTSDPAGFSRWDASNTFYEMRMGKSRNLSAPPRTLLLLYASDLMFRLRWEIEPAVKEGHTVVAAPYVETAVALGSALGLAKDWLTELFRFAPAPEALLRIKEKVKKGKTKEKKKTPKMEPGFVEFCGNVLSATSPDWDAAAIRAQVLRHFDGMEERKEIVAAGKKPPKGLKATKRHAD